MSPLLIGFVGVLLLPLFVATWRASLLGLAAQGLLLAVIAFELHGQPRGASDWLTLFDLAVVRGLFAPAALYGALRSIDAPPRNDVIPPNLLSWTFAFGGVLVAFNVGDVLVPESGDAQTLVSASISAVLLGFLVLATQAGHFSQMVGALRIENGIALFELGSARHHESVEIQAGQIAIFVLTVGLYRGYLAALGTGADAPVANGEPEAPTL
jgi:hydrogenase-4 membrane subunit HyfE